MRSLSMRVPCYRLRGLNLWLSASPPTLICRALISTAHSAAKQLPPRPKISEDEIEENFLKGSGPGGQKINKTNSAVQLKHLPTGLVVKCQETRSRQQNRKIARALLAEKLEELEFGENSRTQIKAREEARKKASKRKKSLRKYRALNDARTSPADQPTEGGEEAVAPPTDGDCTGEDSVGPK